MSRILLGFPPRLARMLLRRVLYKYVVYDASPAALYVLLGMLTGSFGTLFGAYHWWQSVQTGIPATASTVVVALLPFIIGFLFLLQAVALDIAQSPRVCEPRQELDVREVPRRFRGGSA